MELSGCCLCSDTASGLVVVCYIHIPWGDLAWRDTRDSVLIAVLVWGGQKLTRSISDFLPDPLVRRLMPPAQPPEHKVGWVVVLKSPGSAVFNALAACLFINIFSERTWICNRLHIFKIQY